MRFHHLPPPARRRAVLLALLVTFLWSTSWILIKIGLKNIPALPFAGLRYFLAACILLPMLLGSAGQRAVLRRLSRRSWTLLVILGVLHIGFTMAMQYIGLALLPTVTVSLIFNLSVLGVSLFGWLLLGEKPTGLQGLGVALFLVGVLVYFYPARLPGEQWTGLVLVSLGMAANVASTIISRALNRSGEVPPLAVTAISIGIGGPLLFLVSVLREGFPAIDLAGWAMVAWIVLANTVLAFIVWNHTMRTLTAMESSIISGTMLIQIALLAWLILGEALTAQTTIGLALVAAGVSLVQARRAPRGRRDLSAVPEKS